MKATKKRCVDCGTPGQTMCDRCRARRWPDGSAPETREDAEGEGR